MKYILRIISGTITCISGIGIFIFVCSLFIQQQTWLMAGALLTFFAFGIGLLNLGIAIMKGKDVKGKLEFLFFIGRRTP